MNKNRLPISDLSKEYKTWNDHPTKNPEKEQNNMEKIVFYKKVK